MEETANSVARPCRKRRVKRKVRLNKLSHAHLAGFIVSSPVEPCLTCITQMLLILDFMERKRGGWGLAACQHFLCLSSTERAKDEEEGGKAIRGVAVLSSWPTLAYPYYFLPPQSLSSCGTFLCFPHRTSSLPQLWSFCEAFLATDCVLQCLSRLNLCLNCADHHHCVGNVLIFTDFIVDFVQFEKKCFSLFTWPSVF